MSAPIIIVGHGRSGTTIVGELFQGVPGFEVRYERSAIAMGWAGPAQRPLNEAKVRAWYCPDGKRVVDKEPRNTLRAAELCRITGGRAIHLRRDGRDVACSVIGALRRREKTVQQWLRLRRGDLFPQQPGPAELQRLETLPPRVAVGVFWAYLETMARDTHQVGGPVAVLPYESLVHSPRTCAAFVAAHVGMTNPQRDAFMGRAERLLTDDPHGHVARASAAMHNAQGRHRRVARWRDEWTAEELKQLRFLAGHLYSDLGYPLDEETAS